MEARLVDALPEGAGWQFEPKWDGFRCLAFRDGDAVELRAKSGKPLRPLLPRSGRRAPRARARPTLRDRRRAGHPTGGALSFDALQMRLHPAESRIRKLAAETPAHLIAVRLLLAPGGAPLIDAPLAGAPGSAGGVVAASGRRAA